MKVGLITMHGVVHHGSVLQAYATQQLIESLGHECVIIDYKYPNKWQFERGIEEQKKNWNQRLHEILRIKYQYKRLASIKKFMKEHYNLTCPYNSIDELEANPPICDLYLTGSDQVWNPRFAKGDPGFFLTFAPKGAPKVALSASFASAEIPEEYKTKFTTYLNEYKAISVREKKGKEIVKELTGRDVPVTLDPTLLLNKKQWNELLPKNKAKEKFIFLYMLDYAYDPKPYIYELVKYLQDKEGFIVISNGKIPQEFDIKYKNAEKEGIEGFLQLIRDAEIVVTSSFHGVAFSVNFGTPVLAVVPENVQDDRLTSLLESLNLKNAIVTKGSEFGNLIWKYEERMEQKKLEKMREKTVEYIYRILDN